MSVLFPDQPLDLCCLGIQNDPAFNDPPVADFDDPADLKVVELDPDCRAQQVHEGHFPAVDSSTHAITVTIPALLRAGRSWPSCPRGEGRAGALGPRRSGDDGLPGHRPAGGAGGHPLSRAVLGPAAVGRASRFNRSDPGPLSRPQGAPDGAWPSQRSRNGRRPARATGGRPSKTSWTIRSPWPRVLVDGPQLGHASVAAGHREQHVLGARSRSAGAGGRSAHRGRRARSARASRAGPGNRTCSRAPCATRPTTRSSR